MAYSDPAWDDVLAENKRMRAALKMVASKITTGDDKPDDTWADFTGAETQQIFDALSAEARSEAVIPLATLKWWRELVDLNPADLAPRMDDQIKRIESA